MRSFTQLSPGESIELNGFLDLSGLAAAAGFKLRARNMTAMGVQVLRTVFNKNFSTGDDLWGLPWVELPPSLQVYGIGDIRFGFICYTVLVGIMLRDLFPDPEIVCKNLGTEQRGAVSWFLEWHLKSLEGVELHPDADEKAQTLEELLAALRFQDSRNELEKSSSPTIYCYLDQINRRLAINLQRRMQICASSTSEVS